MMVRFISSKKSEPQSSALPEKPEGHDIAGTLVKRDPEPSWSVESAGIELHEFSSHQTRA
jgi:hypothetical protein